MEILKTIGLVCLVVPDYRSPSLHSLLTMSGIRSEPLPSSL